MGFTVSQLAEHIGAELLGRADDAERQINAVGPVESAKADEITFVADGRHKTALAQSNAAAVIVSARVEDLEIPQLVVHNVSSALIEALRLLAPKLEGPPEGIDPTAKIGRDVSIGEGVSIGACVVVENNVSIGANSVIGSGCKIGENSKLGSDCRLDSGVVIYHNCTLGNGVIVQANSTIGATGFGYSQIDGSHRLVPHNGGVVIEDFVEIGANCCVDRAKFGNTIIGAGTKIDNLVQIAHNVEIGKCCLIVAQVGVSGSCKLGDGVVLGGQVGLADNISIGSGTMVGAQSGVLGDVPAGKQLAWTPAIERKEALRVIGLVLRLPKMAEQLKQLSKRMENLEASEDNKK